jgi:hypothetical protein
VDDTPDQASEPAAETEPSPHSRPAGDLVLTFGRDGHDYRVEARTSDGQDAVGSLQLPFDSEELTAFVVGISRSMRELSMAGAVRRDMADLGRRLFLALFHGPVGDLFAAARQRAEDEGAPLRLSLSLSAVPELLDVPWEVLFDDPVFLAAQPDTPLIRILAEGRPLEPLLVKGTVRILGVIASPNGHPVLDSAAERDRVRRALEKVTGNGLAELTWLDAATPSALQEALRDEYHVLHYIGHSDTTPDGDGVLLLQHDDRSPAPLSGTVLANMIGRRTTLRLVVLNSCKGARTTLTDPYAGIATRLVRLGIPAVVAMQFTMSDEAAVTFAAALYEALIQRELPIDAATAEARLAVLSDGNEQEWATPVLFLRATDSRLFDLSLVGWYTLDGSRPARTSVDTDPKSSYLQTEGFLGLRLSDPIDRAIRLLGSDYTVDGEDTTGRNIYYWKFHESFISITTRRGSIVELTVSIDPDAPSDLRLALPYGLVLGESRMNDTRILGEPRVARGMPEMILFVRWTYTVPHSPEGSVVAQFSYHTLALRDEDAASRGFSSDMDVGDRLIGAATFGYRGAVYEGEVA